MSIQLPKAPGKGSVPGIDEHEPRASAELAKCPVQDFDGPDHLPENLGEAEQTSANVGAAQDSPLQVGAGHYLASTSLILRGHGCSSGALRVGIYWVPNQGASPPKGWPQRWPRERTLPHRYFSQRP